MNLFHGNLSEKWDVPLLLLLSMIWASAFATIKIAVPVVGPLFLVFVRCSIGAAVMGALILYLRRPMVWPNGKRQWLWLFLVGIISTALPFYLISFAEEQITSGMTAILMTTGPLAAIILGHFFTHDEKINRGKLLGVGLGFFAALYLLRDGMGGANGVSLLYPLAAVGAATCYAIGGLAAKRLPTISAEVIAFIVLLSSSFVVLPFMLGAGLPEFGAIPLDAALSLLWLGVMPSGLAFYFRYFLIKRAGYGFVSYVGYLIPLFAALTGFVLLGEVMTLPMLLAMLAIIAGLLFTRGSGDFPWSLSPKLAALRSLLR